MVWRETVRKFRGQCSIQGTGPEHGGVALEYTLVSTFAIFVAIALLGFTSRVFHQKLESIADKLGTELPAFDLFSSEE